MISLPLQPGTIRLARFSALNYPPQSFGTLAKARKFSPNDLLVRGTLSKTHYLPPSRAHQIEHAAFRRT